MNIKKSSMKRVNNLLKGKLFLTNQKDEQDEISLRVHHGFSKYQRLSLMGVSRKIA